MPKGPEGPIFIFRSRRANVGHAAEGPRQHLNLTIRRPTSPTAISLACPESHRRAPLAVHSNVRRIQTNTNPCINRPHEEGAPAV